MPASAVLLILLSALIHSLWNLVGKRSHPSAAFFLAASIAAALALGPVLWFYKDSLPGIPTSVWGLLALTACAQAVYYSALAGAYRSLDLSLVYPIVRALPVPMVALASLLLGRGGQISPLGLLGMGFIVVGCLFIPLQRFNLSMFSQAFNSPASRPGLLLAVLAALGTVGYMLADDAALRILRQTPAISIQPFWIAVFYLSIQSIAVSLALALFVRFNHPERKNWQWVRQSTWRTAAVTGLVITGGYLLVLVAMQLAKDVSYVTAFRQVSIPIGAALGIFVLHEKAYPPKLLGVATIFLGLVMVGLG